MLHFHKRYEIIKYTSKGDSDGINMYDIFELYDNKKKISEKYTYTNHSDSINLFHEKVLLMNREEDDLILYTTMVCEYAYGEPIEIV